MSRGGEVDGVEPVAADEAAEQVLDQAGEGEEALVVLVVHPAGPCPGFPRRLTISAVRLSRAGAAGKSQRCRLPADCPKLSAVTPDVFKPGDGAFPPALTGREGEQAVLTRSLADLSGGQAPPHDVVLTGPRGNGKTVLLQWFERACREARGVDVERMTPSEVRTGEALVDLLLPPTGIRRLLPARISVGVTGIGRAEWPASGPSERSLTKGLIARCRRRPLVVLLDEAHTLDLDVGRLLLNASQNVRADAPFLLVLAGTPGLAEHLGAMNASFWDRLDDGRLGIGLLSDAAARAALVEPLEAHGVTIDAEALTEVVEDSQHYPYFIQIWGRALWRQRTATGATHLTAVHSGAARRDVVARVSDYYEDRYLELDRSGHLAVAERVAAKARCRPMLTYEELKAAVAEGLAPPDPPRPAVHEALAGLQRLGFVWRPPGQAPPARYEPGIPSLMDHVLGHASLSPRSGGSAAPGGREG